MDRLIWRTPQMERNRLKYSLTESEVTTFFVERLIKADGKLRTNPTFPALFVDVITIEKTNEYFRLVYDVKGRFTIHSISAKEAKYKLCKVRKTLLGSKGVPFLIAQDGRTIRYRDPLIKTNDTVQVDTSNGKVTD